jgi:hypothetical protein
MKKKRFSVEQIVSVLKQAQVGVPVAEVIRKATQMKTGNPKQRRGFYLGWAQMNNQLDCCHG